MKCIKRLLLLFSLLSSYSSISQETYNNQIWLDGNFSTFVSRRTAFVGDLGYRYQANYPSWSQVVVRPGIKHTLSSKWKLTAGIGYFDQFYERVRFNTELRFYQGVITKIPTFNFLLIKNYFRLEQRFFTYEDWVFSFRIRNQVTLEINLLNSIKRKIVIPFSVEGFLDLDTIESQIFERSRLRFFSGVDYSHYDKWKIALLYSFQGKKESDIEEFSRTDVMYRLHFYVYLRKSSSFKLTP